MIAGLPGSGKSYFAEKLAENLGAVHINSDQVRNAEKALGQYSFQDKFKVYEEMVRLSANALKEKKVVVVDATFYQQSLREMFFSLAKTLVVPTVFIEVYADESLIRERLKQPRKYSEADFEVYKKIKSNFETITEPHLRLQSNNQNILDMIDTAIQYIRKNQEKS